MGASLLGVDAALLPPAMVGSTVKFGGCSDLPHSPVPSLCAPEVPNVGQQQCPGVTEMAAAISAQGSEVNRGICVELGPFPFHGTFPVPCIPVLMWASLGHKGLGRGS